MHANRFRKLLESSLADAEGITIDTYDVPSVQQPVIRCADGTSIYLTVVHTGNNNEPERIVERDPSRPIAVVERQPT